MRTTIQLEDALLEQAKREAARRGMTLAMLIEQGLRLVLAQRWRVVLPTCDAGGGLQPGIDLDDGSALLDLMDGYR